MEVWRPVPSLPGVMASSMGRILLPPLPAGVGGNAPKPSYGFVTKPSKTEGYSYLAYRSRKFGNIRIHRAVCEAFHGPAPFDGAIVLHIDENASNNRPENLRWGTRKENQNAPGFKRGCAERTRKREFALGTGGFKRKQLEGVL